MLNPNYAFVRGLCNMVHSYNGRAKWSSCHSNRVKESMLKGLLLIAKETGSLVVAEGIENEDEAMLMVRNKVDLAQGYFYGRPQFLELSLATI